MEFQVGKNSVVKGLEEGIVQMSKGQISILEIDFEWAYGYYGYPPIIGPKTDIVYEVELLGYSEGTGHKKVKPIPLDLKKL